MKRSLKTLVALSMLTMVGGAARAQGTAPPTAGQIQGAEHLLVVMDSKRLLESTIESSIQTQLKQMPQLVQVQDVLRNFMSKYMSYESLKPDLVSLYAGSFTEQELRDMAAFYETPLGRTVLTKLPEISAKGAALGQQRVQEHLAELRDAVMARMEQLTNDSAKAQAPKPTSPPKPKPTKPS